MCHLLDKYGGRFLFKCNFDVEDFSICSQFYNALLQWSSDFREDFGSNKNWDNIIWNNEDVPVNGFAIYHKN